jgi:transcriptional regulator with XRE-family HTH domain
MKIPVNPKTLSDRRKALRLTLDDLSERSKVDRQTIHRLERGDRSGARIVTVEKLAKALRCQPEDLQREPTVELRKSDGGELSQVSHRVDTAIKNAYWLVCERYKVSEADIVRVAPLLFVLAAEQSLKYRRDMIDKWWSLQEAVEKAAADLKHLPPGTIYPRNDALAANEVELESIEAHDIFGDLVNKELLDHDLSRDYENPFVSFLQEVSLPFRSKVSPVIFERSSAFYIVCEERIQQIAGDDPDIVKALTYGEIELRDIPKEQLEATAESRLEWLRTHLAEVRAHKPEPASWLPAL